MSSDLLHASSTSYARSGFSNRMGWGKRPALLIIDVCKAYWTEGSPLSLLGNKAAEAAPDSMRHLLSAAREGEVPVAWSEVKYLRPDMADAGLFWLKAKPLDVWLKGDTRGLANYMDGLEPAVEDTVVVKKYASAFFGTTLASELQTLNVDTLVICGVVGSACGDRTAEIQNANLFDLDAKYADVVSEEEAMENLRKKW
ncbi:hypothetical protein N7476_001684 [Penicillium atrosanguineum]|uniref:Isochorismatase-like domain-containing protein n=1 Tax=Penicillium atrosanguineum TaxID=1132637 RepID=A0A9W9QDX7_9EURO|nr:hypothetical protein N7476_001684 [Penicillium atrosanguineum]